MEWFCFPEYIFFSLCVYMPKMKCLQDKTWHRRLVVTVAISSIHGYVKFPNHKVSRQWEWWWYLYAYQIHHIKIISNLLFVFISLKCLIRIRWAKGQKDFFVTDKNRRREEKKMENERNLIRIQNVTVSNFNNLLIWKCIYFIDSHVGTFTITTIRVLLLILCKFQWDISNILDFSFLLFIYRQMHGHQNQFRISFDRFKLIFFSFSFILVALFERFVIYMKQFSILRRIWVDAYQLRDTNTYISYGLFCRLCFYI